MKIQDYAYRNPDADRIEYGVTRVIEARQPGRPAAARPFDRAALVAEISAWRADELLRPGEAQASAQLWFGVPRVRDLTDEQLIALYGALSALADHRWLERDRTGGPGGIPHAAPDAPDVDADAE